MPRLAERTSRISSSPIMAVTAAVENLRRSGVEVVDLGAGEPDFRTPDAINTAAHRAIDEGFSKYTLVGGVLPLRRAICERYRADYGVTYSESEVIVSAGGKQALLNTALALFGPGDEVILHVPGWPTLGEQVKLAGATPVVVRADPEKHFALDVDLFLAAVTDRTKGIIINSPCNPTGALISEAALAELGRQAERRGFWLVLDLCYEKLIHENVPHNLPGVIARCCRDAGVICGSASKAYAMTGWRCGWSLGPAHVIAAQNALQSQSTSNVTSITQMAVLAALTGDQAAVSRMRDEYRERRDQLCQWLAEEPQLAFQKPAGAFYLFVDVRRAMAAAGYKDSTEFATQLLEEARVAVTPGEAFEGPGFVRISYATSQAVLREGSRRLIEFVRRHQPSYAS